MNAAWLGPNALAALGLAACGDNVRIDPFCILSAGAGLQLGNHVHIGPHGSICGRAPIQIDDHVNLSHGVRLFSSSDDFASGLAGPMVPERFRAVVSAPLLLRRHALVGANTVVLPGALLGEGAAVGALSLVKGEVAAWWIHAGCPARPLRRRDRDTVLARQRALEEASSWPPAEA